MKPQVRFSPEAEDQLGELYEYIAEVGSPERAAAFTEAIIVYCEGLAQFPVRGTSRNDIRPGLRTTSYKRRTIIAFAMIHENLVILGIFYGGRDYETILREAGTTDD